MRWVGCPNNYCSISDIDVNLVAADIDVLESDGVAQVCVFITDGVLAIDVDIFLKTDDDSAAGTAHYNVYPFGHHGYLFKADNKVWCFVLAI